jgi:hypothetical protein
VIERLDMVAETRRIGRVELLCCAALALTATLTAEGIRTSSLQVTDPAESAGNGHRRAREARYRQ